APSPPSELVKCLLSGLSSTASRPVLDSWVGFLVECLPILSETIFQILIPLVECLCSQIDQTFNDLKRLFEDLGEPETEISPESTMVSLLNALEQILATAHDRLIMDEMKSAAVKSTEHTKG